MMWCIISDTDNEVSSGTDGEMELRMQEEKWRQMFMIELEFGYWNKVTMTIICPLPRRDEKMKW
jgi:hypothetical protein